MTELSVVQLVKLFAWVALLSVTEIAASSAPTPASRAELLQPQLNSERIEQMFGSYGIDVIESNAEIRVSNLYSTHDDVRTTRSFAVVRYPHVVPPEFEVEHQRILRGESIGKVFKENGWTIEKRHRFFAELAPSDNFETLYSMYGTPVREPIALHLYALFVSRNGNEFEYARIAELHSPRYLAFTDLEAIYGVELARNRILSEPVLDFLDVIVGKIKALP